MSNNALFSPEIRSLETLDRAVRYSRLPAAALGSLMHHASLAQQGAFTTYYPKASRFLPQMQVQWIEICAFL
ncbi:hypothetical protein ACFWQK_14395 [Brachybacterium paraconglomeratum]